MAFQGNQHLISIPDLFGIIMQQKLHGMLVIASPTRERSFYFQQGQVVYALCNQPREMFGATLIRETGLSREMLSRIAAQLPGDRYLGEELVHRSIVAQATIDEVANKQIRSALREVLAWTDWAFHFQELPTPKNLPPFRLSTQHLVFDIAREVDEWASIDKLFRDLQAIPKVADGQDIADLPFSLNPDVVSPEEALELVATGKSLRDLLTCAPGGALPTATAIDKLVQSGHIVLEKTRRGESQHSSGTRICALTMVHHLPAHVLQLFEAGEERFPDLNRLVFSDPVLAARALKIGALYGHYDQQDSIEIEVLLGRLGQETLHSVLLSETIRTLYLSQAGFNWYPIWEYAYRCSVTAREIASRAEYPHPDMAQIGAIVQDLGRLMLATLDGPKYYEASQLARGRTMTLVAAEEEYFQVNHTKVGSQLAMAWDFPDDICEVIQDHHLSGGPTEKTLVDIVRLANKAISATLPCGLPDVSDDDEMEIAASLGLTPGDVEEIRAFARTTDTPAPVATVEPVETP